LADRDQQLNELRSAHATAPPEVDGETPNPEDTATLVGRLEELLDELEQSDRRIREMEQLLRGSDEAAQAEREERRHIENWVSDIEQRVLQREEEMSAQTQTLQNRLQQACRERSEFEERMRQYALAAGSSDVSRQELERLREKNHELGQQMGALQETCDQLKRELQQAQNAANAGQATGASPDVREEQVRLAQEKALLARQQVELASMRSELERVAQPQQRPGRDIDNRMRAFREHLREIHEEEKIVQSERGLASRLSQLWRRLEGRG
jgi:chromosome segregation ATPase